MRYVLLAATISLSVCSIGQEQSQTEAQQVVTIPPDNHSATLHATQGVALGPTALRSLEERPPALALESPPLQRLPRVVDTRFTLLTMFQVAANVADVETTVYGLSHRAYEANPIIGAHPSRGKLYAISMPISAGVALCTYKLKKTAPHRNVWMIPPVVVGGVHTGAAIYNFLITH